MEFRKIFDTIPAKFDKWRPHYCPAAFNAIISEAQLGPGKAVLEIGPGTGQATEPILQTGCDYLAIELGVHLAAYMRDKFAPYTNFRLVNADFVTYGFGPQRFDLVFSAATIQWIPEEIAFTRAFSLLKEGGTLAMMLLLGDYQTPNQALYDEIQQVYAAYFQPDMPYTQKFNYQNAVNYGFTDFKRFDFPSSRVYTADEYIEYLGTHSDHLTLRQPYAEPFFQGIRSAILRHGDRIEFNDTIVLFLAQKPFNN